ncbi:MAG TPA: hypothetical protein VN715_16675 [Roseiarcus sp.]|nr:hypothetical protein [Roseiarcus sp.]
MQVLGTRVLGTAFLAAALMGVCAPAGATEALPENGAAKLAAYQVCQPLASIDMSVAGSETFTECHGIVKNHDSEKQPDNLAIHCIEDASARPEAYKYAGTCVLTDSDSDKLYMTYGGSNSGQMKWIGGTGKYKDVSGAGNLRVIVAPRGGSGVFAFTLDFDVTWTNKAK